MNRAFCRSCLVALACGVILFVRKPDAFLNPQFWAEDGLLFSQAREGWSSCFQSYGRGQSFVIQRCFAYGLSWLPVGYAPVAYLAAAVALSLLACSYIANCGIKSRVAWMLPLSIWLVYTDGGLYAWFSHVHWVLALVLIMFAAAPEPRTRSGRIVQGVAAFFLSLSGPFSTYLWPFFVARAIALRSRFSATLLFIVAVCGAYQLMNVSTTRQPGYFDPWDPDWQRFLGRSASGCAMLGDLAHRIPIGDTWFVVLSIVVAYHVAGYVFRSRDREVATIFGSGLLTLATGAWIHRYVPHVLVGPGFRYFFIPTVCLAWSLVLIAERSPELRAKATVGIGLMIFAASTHFVFAPLPNLHWARASRCFGGPVACDVPINPISPLPWHVRYTPVK